MELSVGCSGASSTPWASLSMARGRLPPAARLPIERPARPIMDRDPVTVPLQTGLVVIDALIPIGRGRRELILGDTGKPASPPSRSIPSLTSRDQNVRVRLLRDRASVPSAVAKVVANLREKGRVGLHGRRRKRRQRPAGTRLHRPVRRDQHCRAFYGIGPRDVLIVYDDLTHPCPCLSRAISLLLRAGHPAARRSPAISSTSTRGCWSVPRIFATILHGGSLTALPTHRDRGSAGYLRVYSDQSHLDHGRSRSTCRQRCSELGRSSRRRCRQVRFTRRRQEGRGWAARIEELPVISSSPTRSSLSWNRFAKFGTTAR